MFNIAVYLDVRKYQCLWDEEKLMANTVAMQNQSIKNNWSLMAFARAHGQMKVGEFTNKQPDSPNYGQKFKACVFVDPQDSTNTTFVAFSSKLGVLTPAQIVAQKNELQVIELESGSHILCRQGSYSWDDVDLGL